MCCQVLNSIYLDDYQVVAQLIERLMRLKRSFCDNALSIAFNCAAQ